MIVTIRLSNNNKLPNIMKSKYCILCMKNYSLKVMNDVAIGILKSGTCSVLFNKTTILQQKKLYVPFYRRFVCNIFFKKILKKKTLE